MKLINLQYLPRTQYLLRSVFFLLITSFYSGAFAQYPSTPPAPPVRYQFTTTTNNVQQSYPVSTRMDLCTQWLATQNPKPPTAPIWTNPRLLPSLTYGSGNYGNPMPSICVFTSIYNDPDYRSPGQAYCGDDYASYASSPFVIDQFAIQCVCPPGTLYYADVKKCVKTTKFSDTRQPNVGPPDCNCDAAQPPMVGEPIDPGTGNMWHIETDFWQNAPGGLKISRVYNSTPMSADARAARMFGANWTNVYDSALRHEIPTALNTSPSLLDCWKREDNGFSWCTPRLSPTASNTPGAVSILRGNGKRYFFNLVGGVWKSDADTNDRVKAIYSPDGTAVTGWIYTSAQDGTTENFDTAGRLLSIIFRNGTTQRLTYSDGINNDTNTGRIPADAPVCRNNDQLSATPKAAQLLCVTDQWGRQLTFEFDSMGRVKKMLDPSAQSYLYEYDGPSGGCLSFDAANPSCTASNLTKVTYPDGASKTFVYNEASRINNGNTCRLLTNVSSDRGPFANSLTGLIDENGQRHISWGYDCLGNATASELGTGANKVTVAYSTNLGTVVEYSGSPSAPTMSTRTFAYSKILNLQKNWYVDKPCVECGPYKFRNYDANGNVANVGNWDGKYTCYQYDLSRNLEVARVEGASNNSMCADYLKATSLPAPIRKITTKWHDVFRLPVSIAEPKKITNYVFDDFGNLLNKTENTTTDESGALGLGAAITGTGRTSRHTYNNAGQPLTLTTGRGTPDYIYTYDAQGNLSSQINALGHTTKFLDYDNNGKVGRIEEPNGVVKTFTYSPRGWTTSVEVIADGVFEKTLFDYDGSGQVSKVTLPDNSFLNYVYDEAHRLTKITDSLGNSINYILDIRGNRIGEQVQDPNGALIRQISRVFNNENRVVKTVGAAQ